MPATPEKAWRAIRAGGMGQRSNGRWQFTSTVNGAFFVSSRLQSLDPLALVVRLSRESSDRLRINKAPALNAPLSTLADVDVRDMWQPWQSACCSAAARS